MNKDKGIMALVMGIVIAAVACKEERKEEKQGK